MHFRRQAGNFLRRVCRGHLQLRPAHGKSRVSGDLGRNRAAHRVPRAQTQAEAGRPGFSPRSRAGDHRGARLSYDPPQREGRRRRQVNESSVPIALRRPAGDGIVRSLASAASEATIPRNAGKSRCARWPVPTHSRSAPGRRWLEESLRVGWPVARP